MVMSLLSADVEPISFDIKLTDVEIEKELKRKNAKYDKLVYLRSPYDDTFEDIAAHIRPGSFQRSAKSRTEGFDSRSDRLNEVAYYASRTARAGMHTGASSPSRPWFDIGHPDPELNKELAVKQWCTFVLKAMRSNMQRSNLYKTMPQTYGNLLDFGIAAVAVLPDEEDTFRFYPKTMGTFAVSTNKRGVVDTYTDEQTMTVRQVVKRFGIDNVSQPVRNNYNNDKKEETVTVCWLVEPNEEYNKVKAELQPRYKLFRSTYWEKGKQKEGGLLSVSGFDVFPVLCPRWEPKSDSAYSHDYPGLGALDICKQLKNTVKQLALARELGIRPPMNAHPNLRGIAKGVIPGFVNFTAENEFFTPTLQARIETLGTLQEKAELEQSLRQMYFNDIFLMVTQERNNVTATQILAEQQEKMMVLGPVLSGLDDEFFDQLIDLVYYYMDQKGLIPDPPSELVDIKLEVEYISVLAQAQKATDVSKVDRAVGSIAQLATVDPEAIDLLDIDKTGERYLDLLGEQGIQRSKDQIEKIRKARQEAAAQQQQAESLQAMAQTGQTLSATSVEDTNALGQLLQGAAV